MSKIARCRACGHDAAYRFSGSLIGETVRYYECGKCELIETEEPFWLERAYSSAINDSDTGLVSRNLWALRVTILTLFLMKNLNGRIVDFAGGYGLLTRLLRDKGIDARWSDSFCQNLLAKGFEYDGDKAQLVTAFEAFEHFVEPAHELEKMLDIAPTVLFSTLLCPLPAPKFKSWWYYGAEHGQHIALYRKKSLESMAKKNGARLISDGAALHIITRDQFPEQFWLAALRLRLERCVPIITKLILKSKTIDDHQAIAQQIAFEIEK